MTDLQADAPFCSSGGGRQHLSCTCVLTPTRFIPHKLSLSLSHIVDDQMISALFARHALAIKATADRGMAGCHRYGADRRSVGGCGGGVSGFALTILSHSNRCLVHVV
jgi:hypothetical protein